MGNNNGAFESVSRYSDEQIDAVPDDALVVEVRLNLT